MFKNDEIFAGKTLAKWTAQSVRKYYKQQKQDRIAAAKIAANRIHNFNKKEVNHASS